MSSKHSFLHSKPSYALVMDYNAIPNYSKDPYIAFYQNYDNKILFVVDDNKRISLDGKKILFEWALECVKHVLHVFENKYPKDYRLGDTLNALSTSPNLANFDDYQNFHQRVIQDYVNIGDQIAVKMAVAVKYLFNHPITSINYARDIIQSTNEVLSDTSRFANNREDIELEWQKETLLKIINEKYMTNSEISLNETKVSLNETKVSLNETKVSLKTLPNNIDQEIIERRLKITERRQILDNKKKQKELDLLKLEEDELALEEAEWEYISNDV